MTAAPLHGEVVIALLCSYIVVALLGFVLGHVHAAVLASEDASWGERPPAVIDLLAAAPYDWEREGVFR